MLSRFSGGSALASAGRSGGEELLRVGAVLVDVRKPGEWDAGPRTPSIIASAGWPESRI
jgi:hypothetical protein